MTFRWVLKQEHGHLFRYYLQVLLIILNEALGWRKKNKKKKMIDNRDDKPPGVENYAIAQIKKKPAKKR